MRHTVETPNASDQPPSGAGDFDTLVDRPTVRGATIMAVTNGTRASGAALKLAAELSERDGEWLEVLTVERPFPAAVEGFRISAAVVRTPDHARGEALRAVTEQLVTLMTGDRWSLRVEFGLLAPTIVRAAKEQKAKLIILGRSERKGFHRTIDADTAAHILQSTTVPVLEVPESAHRLPHSAVVLMDFSPSSFRAARTALALLEPPATLHLLHVRARIDGAKDAEGWAAVYDRGISVVLTRLAQRWTREGITVDTPLVFGSVTTEALPYARSVGADLIACGSHGCSAVERVLLGSVSSQLLREASCAVLVAPPEVTTKVSP